MKEYYLENNILKLTVADHGAEIRSLVRLSAGKELMWQADPAFWGRTSPVLFPLVGQYWNKTSYYEGKAYQMSQHGFARDMDFAVLEQTEKELWFELTDSDSTLALYPFHFRLLIGYRLEEDTVTVCWKVINTDTRKMYFSIGGHPAFGCDLEHSFLMFQKDGAALEKDMTCNVIDNDGSGCLSDRQKTLSLSGGCLAMSDELFSEDALIIEDRQADEVTLLNDKKERVLGVKFDSPLFGIWSPVGKHAPFVCIEPWYGRCDRSGFNGRLEKREYGNSLEAGEEFCASYHIRVY